ncbi:ABC transporter ATP-binding protein [Luteococcus peritonei]|uniref:ABC transporter ATP-binding protein n=1 Tax=Luteococcus peritonei TaxID=88874 RepID=A0ABW4RWM8_9ACTN
MAILEMRGVSRHYESGANQVLALDGLDLSVEAGEFVAVMGPSGSGKSTLLAVAGGLDEASSGEVLIDGRSLAGLGRDQLAELRRRGVGYVFQDFNLVPILSARENVMLPLELDGARPQQARAQAEKALCRVGLDALGDRPVEQLSGGQRQRVAVARGIVGERRLLLADEPTGSLDSTTGDEVLSLLRDLADEGAAVVLVTHDARHAGWADRVVFLRDGRLLDSAAAATDVTEAAARVGALLEGQGQTWTEGER